MELAQVLGLVLALALVLAPVLVRVWAQQELEQVQQVHQPE